MAVIDLQDAIGIVSGLINTAEWLTVQDASCTNGSPTITSPTATFTDSDIGKFFSFVNAQGSKPWTGKIISRISGTQVTADSNAGNTVPSGSGQLTYGGTSADPRHPVWTITNVILQKDLEVCNMIIKTPNHPRRNFFTFTAQAQQAQTGVGIPVVSHVGELLKVEIKHTDTVWRIGKQLPQEYLPKLLTWVNNRSSLFTSASEGYYIIADGMLHFTGQYIRPTFAEVVFDKTACQAPQEYTGLVSVLAAAEIFATEGDDLAASNLMMQLGGETLTTLITKEALPGRWTETQTGTEEQ